jgi:hypothetical protein
MEFVVVAILIISAIASIWGKIQEQKQQHRDIDQAPRGPRPPVTQSGQRDLPTTIQEWQQEFKRILEEKRPPALPPQPPPVPAARRSRAPIVATLVEEDEEGEANIPQILPNATAAFSRGTSLQQRIEQRMARVDEQTQKHRPSLVQQSVLTPNKLVAQEIVKSRASLKHALLASIILGPPRGTEL